MDINVNTAENLDRPHILVVDDDPALLDITLQLIEHLGYFGTAATGSNEAIRKIKENPETYDAVLTDYSLPIINGVELSKMIKELSVNLPIILCSGKVDLLDEGEIYQAGIADVARKPYTLNELDSIIKGVIT